MMKYVVTTRGPVLMPLSFNHDELKRIGLSVRSAGTFMLAPDGKVFIGPVGSLSLNKNPHDDDENDITDMLNISMKYVNVERRGCVLFPPTYNHVDFESVWSGFTSAGFAHIEFHTTTGTPALCVNGESVSLGLRHDVGDGDNIKRVLFSDF